MVSYSNQIHLNSPFPTKKNRGVSLKIALTCQPLMRGISKIGRFWHAAARVEKQDQSLGAGEAERSRGMILLMDTNSTHLKISKMMISIPLLQ